MGDMSGIVVGIDGSGHSERALEWAVREAGLRQVPLTVIAVHQPVISHWGSAVSYPEDHAMTVRIRDAAREQTDKVIDRLGEGTPPQVNINAVSGSPAEELLVAGKRADLIVLGSRGAGGFARLVMGSVSYQVTHHAHCPVVVIPADDR
ncbi:universal stress protein [Trebonia kvetii]|uniref:Universal stress protein n=2 Tax=Trebonia kvetii TaxID=2480626 RepID=A0A6P2C2D3_9ACTN|nr:universal stress protein [Trebonia kvetii]